MILYSVSGRFHILKKKGNILNLPSCDMQITFFSSVISWEESLNTALKPVRFIVLTSCVSFLLAAPKFTVSLARRIRNLIAVPVGNSVKLDCSAEGYPRPTVVWYKDGALFQERKEGSSINLNKRSMLVVMRDVVPSDSGIYTCNVSNRYGWINHSYSVDVHGKGKTQIWCNHSQYQLQLKPSQ